MTYILKCDEPHWVETDWVFDENEEALVDTDREITDTMDDKISYYWIESTERDEVLKVMDFVEGEAIMRELHEGKFESLEDAEEEYEYAEIRDERPPQ